MKIVQDSLNKNIVFIHNRWLLQHSILILYLCFFFTWFLACIMFSCKILLMTPLNKYMKLLLVTKIDVIFSSYRSLVTSIYNSTIIFLIISNALRLS